MLQKVQNVVKSFQKPHTAESCLSMKRFSLSKRNSISKMTAYMQKVDMWQTTKSQGFGDVIIPFLVLVWWGVLYSSAIKVHFSDAGVKTNAEVY